MAIQKSTRVAAHQESRTQWPIARLVVKGRSSHVHRHQHNHKALEKCLYSVFTRDWPDDADATFLITPGGFAVAPFPVDFNGKTGWFSQGEALAGLRTHAEKVLARILSSRVRRVAEGRVAVMTVGIDLFGDDDRRHIELIAIYDVATQTVSWTGKSYPTPDQENSLIQIVDLGTHFHRLAGERVAILGCNDLNMFSPRVWASQRSDSARRLRCVDMRQRLDDFDPTIILQHPHCTESAEIWRSAWEGLTNRPSLKAWASAISYHPWGKKTRPRQPIETVLTGTQREKCCLDPVVRI